MTVEIRSEVSGVITKCFAHEQDKVDVGADFIEFDTDAKAPAKEETKKTEEKTSKTVQSEQDTNKTAKVTEQPRDRQEAVRQEVIDY